MGSCPAVIFYNGKMIKEGDSVFFLSDFDPVVTTFIRSWSRDALGSHIHQRLGFSEAEKISRIIYRMPVGNLGAKLVAIPLKIQTDEDVLQMFDGFDRASGYLQYIEVLVESVNTGGAGYSSRRLGEGMSDVGPSTRGGPRNLDVNISYGVRGVEQDTQNPRSRMGNYCYSGVDERQPMNEDVYENATEALLNPPVERVSASDDIELEDAEDDVEYQAELDWGSDEDETSHGPAVRSIPAQNTQQYSALPFMRRLNVDVEDLDNVNVNVPVYDPNDPNAELAVGMTFADKESLLLMLKQYRLQKNVDYIVKESETHKYYGVCKLKSEGCKWRLWAKKGVAT